MSQFAMCPILIFFLSFFALFGMVNPATAQDSASSLYQVADVAVDITAKSAADARDQAITAAQHQAFTTLVGRIGLAPSFGRSLSDNDIATLVQSFEVQNERASSVRYIGTFTVRFKTNAVHKLLANAHANYSETRSRPYIVIPIYSGNGHSVLWEEKTRWRSAWGASQPDNGVVPITVPSGGNDDTSVIASADTIVKKPDSIRSMIEKYQAEGGIIVLLKTDISIPVKQLDVDMQRFGTDGTPQPVEHIAFPITDDKIVSDASILQLVGKVREQLDKDWRANPSTDAEIVSGTSASDAAADGVSGDTLTAETTTSNNSITPTAHLTVEVTISNLAEWAVIKRQLDAVPLIARTNIITLQRGVSMIDVEFHGTIPQLQRSSDQQGLNLSLTNAGVWTLKRVLSGQY